MIPDPPHWVTFSHSKTEHLEHTLLDGGIHYVKGLKATRQGIDDFVAVLLSIYSLMPADDCVLVICDVSECGMPSLSYVMRVLPTFRKRAGDVQSRIVYFVPDSGVFAMTRTVLDMLRLHNARRMLIVGQDFDLARQWLLAERAALRNP